MRMRSISFYVKLLTDEQMNSKKGRQMPGRRHLLGSGLKSYLIFVISSFVGDIRCILRNNGHAQVFGS